MPDNSIYVKIQRDNGRLTEWQGPAACFFRVFTLLPKLSNIKFLVTNTTYFWLEYTDS